MPVADEETLRQFEAGPAARPETGDLIRHSGGLRKARMKLPGRGRSSGARVIYLWLPEARRFVLFMLCTKARQTDIAPALLARLRPPKYCSKKSLKPVPPKWNSAPSSVPSAGPRGGC